MASMRVAIVSQLYSPRKMGGAELSVQLLAEELVRKRHEVHVITTLFAGLQSRESIKGVNVHRVHWGNVYSWEGNARSVLLKAVWHGIDVWNPVAFNKMQSLLQKLRCDVLHTNTLAGLSVSVWSAARSLGIPTVHTLRDFYLLCFRSSMFRGGRSCPQQCAACRLPSLPKRAVAERLNAVVGISQYVLAEHEKVGFFSNIPVTRVIPNGVVVPAPDSMERRPATLSLGYLGRLHPSKGLEGLLDELLSSDFSGWERILLAGQGDESYEANLRAKYNDARIQFLGRVSASELFRKIEILVVPSIWREPFGRVVIEAYAHGVPVLATRRGGIPELVEEGKTGFLYDPEQRGAVSKLLTRLSETRSLLSELSEYVTAASSRYSSEAVCAEYESVYDRVVGAHHV
jgi:glycosyltransferase involved in cell wall biosynthesis